jgi:hypothetical protein
MSFALTVRLSLILFLAGGFLSCTVKKATVPDATPKFMIPVNVKSAEVDNLGKLYVVDSRNHLINYDTEGKELFRFATSKSGSITTVDVTDPLRTVVFYDDFNQVKILDNTLTVVSEVDLSDKFADIGACGASNDGQLWVFDPVQFRLIKIKTSGEKILESVNVNDVGMVGAQIQYIREKSNVVVLCDPRKGFYVFDNLGQYILHQEATDVKAFQFDGRNITYYTPTGLKRYNLVRKERQLIGFPLEMKVEGLQYIYYQGGDYYEINAKGINILRAPK